MSIPTLLRRGEGISPGAHVVSGRTFVVGTRGSRLALRQTSIVLDQLRSARPHSRFQVRTIRTTGDRTRASLSEIGGRGLFVVELERALLEGKIDIAVHSLKDLPSRETSGLTIAAIACRHDPRDALISRDGLALSRLPPQAIVGTGSPRRAAQLLALRPDLRIVDIRGNVDTRVRKVEQGEYDAIVLAVAGLERLGWLDRATEILPVETMLPAVGQGALAVQVRAKDAEAMELADVIDDPETRAAVTAERAFERRLGGGCQAAIAAFGEFQEGRLRLRGLVADPSGGCLLRGEVEGPAHEAEALGARLADRLIERGASALLGVAS